MAIKDLCRQRGLSDASYYLWRSKFGCLSVPDAKRLKYLDAESTRLKKLLAERIFENDVIKDALLKSSDCAGAQTGAERGREGAARPASPRCFGTYLSPPDTQNAPFGVSCVSGGERVHGYALRRRPLLFAKRV